MLENRMDSLLANAEDDTSRSPRCAEHHFGSLRTCQKEVVRAQKIDPHQIRSTFLHLDHTDAIRRSQFATDEGAPPFWALVSQDAGQAAREQSWSDVVHFHGVGPQRAVQSADETQAAREP